MTSSSNNNVSIETVVRNVIAEMGITGEALTPPRSVAGSVGSTKTSKTKKKSTKDNSKKKKKKKKKKSKKGKRGPLEAIEELLMKLEDLEGKKSKDYNDDEDEDEVEEAPPATSPLAVNSDAFFVDVAKKLGSRKKSLCLDDSLGSMSILTEPDIFDDDDYDDDFEAAFGPNDMRCLALVSHNEMKATMKDFVIQHKHILKKFRLTGTNSTMKMLAEVFADEEDVVFGPSCSSGPLGGDAELVALMTSGKLGGILFFQDPMTSHPHQCDIECLVRQALVHNTLMANTPASAMAHVEVFKMALMGQGKAELIPSFFFDLQSPTVQAYKNNQNKVINSHSTDTN
eukprot:CAMPEP_0116133364 /NCGR_PEP_ID=MMETSP0329-20121206/10064_1 /TAXON_ID=697910 /ORGANISM="Pseudo-nitzschia arenysensis, Strain B593" /LENGTH=341 /DNA_ID=CAMNT_0003627985 /DNA_START=77 /DNA_END=1102 /DNA_ORIENTATION=-